MDNNSYHHASRSIPNWKRLGVLMRSRYGAWKATSDTTWVPRFVVIVTHSNGKLLKRKLEYPFEQLADAVTCIQWWKENGCVTNLEVNPG